MLSQHKIQFFMSYMDRAVDNIVIKRLSIFLIRVKSTR